MSEKLSEEYRAVERPAKVKRTTVSARPDDLAILEREAKRRGVSLSHVLREAVAEYAADLRTSRMPRFGVVMASSGLAQETVDDEGAPMRARARKRSWR